MNLQAWQSSFATLASVCATLSGLLFVALSIKLGRVGAQERPMLLSVAKGSFSEFIGALLIALMMQAPDASTHPVPWMLLIIMMARVWWHISHFRHARRNLSLYILYREFLLPLLSTFGLALAAYHAVNGRIFGPMIYWTVVMIMCSGCQKSWRILLRELER
ncbi:hypothetical protein KSF73_10785 [Burkholderiaceae bacterium DAT-1]|nr:hypothetical protein [Burkholderiaceae bacterium DAT-1]